MERGCCGNKLGFEGRGRGSGYLNLNLDTDEARCFNGSPDTRSCRVGLYWGRTRWEGWRGETAGRVLLDRGCGLTRRVVLSGWRQAAGTAVTGRDARSMYPRWLVSTRGVQAVGVGPARGHSLLGWGTLFREAWRHDGEVHVAVPGVLTTSSTCSVCILIEREGATQWEAGAPASTPGARQ